MSARFWNSQGVTMVQEQHNSVRALGSVPSSPDTIVTDAGARTGGCRSLTLAEFIEKLWIHRCQIALANLGAPPFPPAPLNFQPPTARLSPAATLPDGGTEAGLLSAASVTSPELPSPPPGRMGAALDL